jgi:SAM-dependent methyltransferase
MDPNYARQYRELYERHWWWRAREAVILEVVRSTLGSQAAASILDVGCGDGLLFDRLLEYGNVDGVEANASLVDNHGRHAPRIHICDFEHGFRTEKKYDMILMLDVLEHLAQPVAALRRATSLLRPSGTVLITVPAFRMLWTEHDRRNQHHTRYTKRSLRRLAGEAGLMIRRQRYFFHWMFPLKLVVRLKEQLIGASDQPVKIAPPSVNRFLYWLSKLDYRALGYLRLPFGSSLLALAVPSVRAGLNSTSAVETT